MSIVYCSAAMIAMSKVTFTVPGTGIPVGWRAPYTCVVNRPIII